MTFMTLKQDARQPGDWGVPMSDVRAAVALGTELYPDALLVSPYGSSVTGFSNSESDVDVLVVTRKGSGSRETSVNGREVSFSRVTFDKFVQGLARSFTFVTSLNNPFAVANEGWASYFRQLKAFGPTLYEASRGAALGYATRNQSAAKRARNVAQLWLAHEKGQLVLDRPWTEFNEHAAVAEWLRQTMSTLPELKEKDEVLVAETLEWLESR